MIIDQHNYDKKKDTRLTSPENISTVIIFELFDLYVSTEFCGNILDFPHKPFVVYSNCNEIHPIAFRHVFQTRHKLYNFAFHLTPTNNR